MIDHRLIQGGVLLFLLGLLTGFVIPALAVPRLALSGHLEGVFNGMLLILIGILWPRLRLSATAAKVTAGLLVYGTYVNWLTVTAAAALGAGAGMMPIAGGDATGSALQEGLIQWGLVSLSVAMVLSFAMILWGLRRPDEATR